MNTLPIQKWLRLLMFTPVLISLAVHAQSPADPLSAPIASNYSHAPEMHHLMHWEHFPLHLYFEPSTLATKERKDAVLAGFNQWVSASHNFIHYQIVTVPAKAEVPLFSCRRTASPIKAARPATRR